MMTVSLLQLKIDACQVVYCMVSYVLFDNH